MSFSLLYLVVRVKRMQRLKFSLDAQSVHFEFHQQNLNIEKGLGFIVSKSILYQRLDALALENMIYVIEEILEQLKLDYKSQRIVHTSDLYMYQLVELFFYHEHVITRAMLEHAFNEFVQRIEYYVQKANSSDFYIFAYFVFVREMMHHLNIIKIEFVEIKK